MQHHITKLNWVCWSLFPSQFNIDLLSDSNSVLYNYEPQKASYPFLRLKLGDVVQVLEENTGWYRGFCVRDKHSKGVFPSSHIQLKDCTLQNPG